MYALLCAGRLAIPPAPSVSFSAVLPFLARARSAPSKRNGLFFHGEGLRPSLRGRSPFQVPRWCLCAKVLFIFISYNLNIFQALRIPCQNSAGVLWILMHRIVAVNFRFFSRRCFCVPSVRYFVQVKRKRDTQTNMFLFRVLGRRAAVFRKAQPRYVLFRLMVHRSSFYRKLFLRVEDSLVPLNVDTNFSYRFWMPKTFVFLKEK